MSTEQNKAIARRFRELWNGSISHADQVVSHDCILHVEDPLNPRDVSGPEGLKQIISWSQSAFPDLRMMVRDAIAEGDKVAQFWTAEGTHRAHSERLQGIQPTEKRVTTSGIDFLRISNGKVVEVRTQWDVYGALRQLGVIPQDLKES